MTVTTSLREARERIVREHMETENRHEFDATLETFKHPRYELIATGEVIDGSADVARYYQVIYRNALGPCGFFNNTTSGLQVIWVP